MAGMRNHQGLHTNRLTKAAGNPREVAFAEEWVKENTPTYWCKVATLPQLLGDGKNSREPSPEEAKACATVVQWLGSNVGLGFLSSALARVGLEIVEKKKAVKGHRVERHKCEQVVYIPEKLRRTGRGKSGFERHYTKRQCSRNALMGERYCKTHGRWKTDEQRKLE